MDILDEIEGAITDDAGQTEDFNQHATHHNAHPPFQHTQPFHPGRTFVGIRPNHQQQDFLGYEQTPVVAHHFGSSSSYSQVDSPSPAHGARRDDRYPPPVDAFPACYATQPVFHRAAPLYKNPRPLDVHPSQYHQQAAPAFHPQPQRAPAIRNDAYADDSGAGLYEYDDEEVMNRMPAPKGIVEQTGDRSAMKQMQSLGIPLKPTTVLPDASRRIFNFSSFNAVQSKVLDSVYKTDENLVVASPTGSGKTVIFELAILRAVMNKQFQGGDGRSLCVYVAPLKALCSEKAEEWKVKLGKIGLVVAEVTGDTASDKGFLQQIKTADVIITTPEKWDAVTRRTSQKQKILERLALMMLDEVHILNEIRGATLETVVARMRTTAKDVPVRVVALSATIPNVEDVARWLRPTMPSSTGVFEAGGINPGVERAGANGVLQMPMAKVFKFGEDFRPTKLTRIVKGYPSFGENIFPLINKIISELFSVISDHTQGKPILVFAATRNLCIKAAGTLIKAYQTAKDGGRRLPWSVPSRTKLSCENKQLDEFSEYGIAFHHGGLSLEDRRKVETAFRAGKIMIIVATSTLAVGVNLPAHTVILAGTYQWSGSGMISLTDLDVQQMIGRAGRPQYDTEGTAIILCAENNTAKYRDLINSSTTIESCLHEHLVEHINTEIGLKTITCLQEGQDWIKNSFLYVRIQQNPRHYSGILGSAGSTTYHWEEALTRLVDKAVEDLQGRDMVEIQESESTPGPPELRPIAATVYGEAMSSNCLSFATMCQILDLPSKSSLESLLHALSNAREYADLKLRNGEKLFYKSLGKDPDLRYSLPNGISPSTAAHKVFILIQMTLGNVDWNPYKEQLKQGSSGPTFDSYQVFRIAPRICKAMATIALQKEDGETLKNALALIRIVSGKAWPGTAVIFRQIDAIGPKSITVLGSKGITTFQKLAKTDARQIEMLLNRQTGFGNKIITAAKSFPVFHVTVHQETQVSTTAVAPVDILFRVEITVEGKLVETSKKKAAYPRTVSIVAVLTDGSYVAYRKASAKTLRPEDLTMTLPARFQYSNQRFQVIVGLDQVSGCATQVDCKPIVPDGVLQSPVTNGSVKLEDEVDKFSRPLTPIHHPSVITSRRDEDRDESMIEAAMEEDVQREDIAKLPNGNWPCLHSCVNKVACKHVCCKEGTKKKPKAFATKGPLKQASTQATDQTKQAKKPNDKQPKEKEFPTFTDTQPKTGRIRKRLPLTQYEEIDLVSNSDSSTSEDEEEIMNRILKGKQRKGYKPAKKQKVVSADSNEFDDPSFEKAVVDMDLDLELEALASKKSGGDKVKDKRGAGGEANSRRSNVLPTARQVNTNATEERAKSKRPQPVKRGRQLRYTESLEDQPESLPSVIRTPAEQRQQIPRPGHVKDKARSHLSPKQQPLFATSDEDMESLGTEGDFDREFRNNGLLDLEEMESQALPNLAAFKSVPVLPEDPAFKCDVELDACLGLDEYLPHAAETYKPDARRAETYDSEDAAAGIPHAIPKSAVPVDNHQSPPVMLHGRNPKTAKSYNGVEETHPASSTNKVGNQLGLAPPFDNARQMKHTPSIGNPTTNLIQVDEDRDYTMEGTEEAQEKPEEEDDLLADFNDWVGTGAVQFAD